MFGVAVVIGCFRVSLCMLLGVYFTLQLGLGVRLNWFLLIWIVSCNTVKFVLYVT